jgi:hypothetical protein
MSGTTFPSLPLGAPISPSMDRSSNANASSGPIVGRTGDTIEASPGVEELETGSQSSNATLARQADPSETPNGRHYKHGRSTPDYAEKVAEQYGVGNEVNEKEQSDKPTPLVPTPRRTERSPTISRKVASSDGEMASGYGFAPITKQLSLPPGVGIFGGVAPSGEDAEMGLRAVRSREEELRRESEREKKGPDPFAVRFEPGEATNPKVSRYIPYNCLC